MRREFLLNLFFLVFVNILIKPFYAFGIDLRVQNVVEQGDYGLYFAIFNFSYIFQIIGDLGIHQYNNRTLSQNPSIFYKYFPHFLFIKGGLAMLLILVGALTAWLIGYRALAFKMTVLMLINQVFITLIFFLRSNIAALGHYRLDSLISVSDKVWMIILGIIFLYTPLKADFRILDFVYIQLVSFGVTLLLAWIILRRLKRGKITFTWKPKLWLVLIKKSIPYALVVLLMTLYTRVDGVMIERILGGEEGKIEADVYAFSYRLLDMCSMLSYLFASLLLPMFARLLKEKKELKALLEFAFRCMWVLTISASVTIAFFSEEIGGSLYSEYNSYVGNVLWMLILTFNMGGIIYVFGTLLTAAGRLKGMNILFLITIACNIILNSILIPIWGAWGAAFATILTQGLVAIGEMILVMKWLNWWFSIRFWLQILVFGLGVCGINYAVCHLSIMWELSFLLVGALSLLFAFISKMIDIRLLLQLVKNKKA